MIATALRRVLKLGALACAGALAIGWLQALHPAFDSVSHFRHIIAAGLLATTALLALFGAWHWLIVGSVTFAISLALSWPFVPGLNPGSSTAGQGDGLRVVQANIRFNNSDVQQIARSLLSENADIILIQELTRANIEVMSRLRQLYPHQLECSTTSVGSVALASRLPFREGGKLNCNRFRGYLSAELDWQGQTLAVANLHARWPWPHGQKRHLDQLRDSFAELSAPAIIAGDFNAAPWSDAVHRVASQAGMHVAPGLLLTWRPHRLRQSRLWPLLLPLDHSMATPDLVPVERHLLIESGSDHRPLLTVFRRTTN